MMKRVTVTALALLLLIPIAASAHGLVAYWDFDEGSGSTLNDASGNANHGTINGADWVSGHSGNALWFDGIDDYVVVPSSVSLQLSGQASFSVWVKIDGDYYHEHGSHILSKGATYVDLWADYALAVLDPDGVTDAIAFEVSDGSNEAHYLRVDSAVTTGEWCHLAVVYDAGTSTVYLNGREIAQGYTYNPMRASSQPLYIAHRYASHNIGRLKGSVDEVRIYNRALSEDDVWRLYRHNSVPSLTNYGLLALVLLLVTTACVSYRRMRLTA